MKVNNGLETCGRLRHAELREYVCVVEEVQRLLVVGPKVMLYRQAVDGNTALVKSGDAMMLELVKRCLFQKNAKLSGDLCLRDQVLLLLSALGHRTWARDLARPHGR